MKTAGQMKTADHRNTDPRLGETRLTVLLILFVMPIALLLTLLTEPRVGKLRGWKKTQGAIGTEDVVLLSRLAADNTSLSWPTQTL